MEFRVWAKEVGFGIWLPELACTVCHLLRSYQAWSGLGRSSILFVVTFGAGVRKI